MVAPTAAGVGRVTTGPLLAGAMLHEDGGHRASQEVPGAGHDERMGRVRLGDLDLEAALLGVAGELLGGHGERAALG